MSEPDRGLHAASLLVIPTLLLSGPLGALAVWRMHPQPAWTDVATFAAHYHPVQRLPYVFGFGLLFCSVWFVARAIARGGAHGFVAGVATAVFAALIGLNYTLQVGYVPVAVCSPDGLLAALTMANPSSLAWLLEMVGYGALGAAVLALAPAFAGAGRLRWIRALLVADGVVSLGSAGLTLLVPSWVLTIAGLLGYVAWNLLVVVLMVLVAVETRPRRAHPRAVRWTLGGLLAFAAVSAFGGGFYGMAGAAGVPTEWLAGSPFHDYFVPSLILFAVVGGTLLAAAVGVLARLRVGRTLAYAAGAVLLGWIAAQLSIIGYVSWLQPAVAAAGLLVLALARAAGTRPAKRAVHGRH